MAIVDELLWVVNRASVVIGSEVSSGVIIVTVDIAL